MRCHCCFWVAWSTAVDGVSWRGAAEFSLPLRRFQDLVRGLTREELAALEWDTGWGGGGFLKGELSMGQRKWGCCGVDRGPEGAPVRLMGAELRAGVVGVTLGQRVMARVG